MTDLGVRLALFAVLLVAGPASAEAPARGPVVFVCEHGSVKSMIAALWFERLAAERGLTVRALSRGVEPDAQVPAAIAEHLRRDGFELTGRTPARLQAGDLAGATRVVAIGAKSPLLDAAPASPVRWDDVPPASIDYGAAREALRARILALLDDLERGRAADEPEEARRPRR
jgi:protein-tyrosine-phosphatase